jgi:hypothetical protein
MAMILTILFWYNKRNTLIKSYLLRLISFYFPGTFKFGTRQRLGGGRHFCGKMFFAPDKSPPIQLEICFVHPKDQRLGMFVVSCYSSRQSPRPSQIACFATLPQIFFDATFLLTRFLPFEEWLPMKLGHCIGNINNKHLGVLELS